MCHRDTGEGTCPFVTVFCFALFSLAGSPVGAPGAGYGNKDGGELEHSVTQSTGADVADSEWNTKTKDRILLIPD